VPAVADEDLVKPAQPLPVVQFGDNGDPLLDDRGVETSQQGGRSAVRCRARTPGPAGSTPNTGWSSRCFATLATSPSGPTATTTSPEANQNAGRSARSARPSRQPAGTAVTTASRARRQSVVAGAEGGELVGIAVAQEELHGTRGAVPVQ